MASKFNLPALKRAQIRKILKGKRGRLAQLARDVNAPLSQVSAVMTGKSKSQRILDAAQSAAQEILTEEGL